MLDLKPNPLKVMTLEKTQDSAATASASPGGGK
jgi:hypothetical protein